MQTTAQKNKKTTFVAGAAILGIAGFLCKVIGAFFRVPLYNLMGDGMAYYEAVYPYYSWLLVISTAGIPTAISRMVSERVAVGDHAAARRVFRKAQVLLLGIGVGTAVLMYAAAPALSNVVEVGTGVVRSFRALAPALLFVSLMCAYRGYLQGLQCMEGTAVSQLTEQVVKLFAGLAFAKMLLPKGLDYAAMGALLGISLSELLALVIISVFYLKKAKALPAEGPSTREKGIYRSILAIAIPVTLGASIMPLTGIIDSVLIVSTLKDIGFSEAEANLRYVALRSNVTTIINMPAVLSSALAMSLVPAVSAARKRKDRAEIRSTIATAVKIAVGIGLPCAAGLYVLSSEVIDFLYTIDAQRLQVASDIMKAASVGVIFLSLVQTLTGIMQGLGKQIVPVINLAIGAAAKVIVMLVLMRIPSVNIIGAAVSTVVCYVVAGTLDFLWILKAAKPKLNYRDVFGKPLLACLVMALAVWGVKVAVSSVSGSVAICTAASIGIGVAVYLVLIFVFRFFDAEDLQRIPGGRKLARWMHISSKEEN